MIEIADPQWRPDDATIARLNRAVAQEIQSGRSSEFSLGQRKQLSKRLAMEATMAMLEPLSKSMPVVDADTIRVNMPGYDILVDGWLRIQVKGGTYVDSIGWAHSPESTDAADLQFDIEVAVDIGCVLNPRPFGMRGDGRENVPVEPRVAFYIIPGDVVRAEVARGRRVNKRGAHLYFYKRELRQSTKEYAGQWREMAEWRGRFDVITAMLGTTH